MKFSKVVIVPVRVRVEAPDEEGYAAAIRHLDGMAEARLPVCSWPSGDLGYRLTIEPVTAIERGKFLAKHKHPPVGVKK